MKRLETAQWALIISILSAAGTIGNAYFTHRKTVKATLAIVGYGFKQENDDSVTFAFHSVINNNGTQPVTVLTAEAFAVGLPGFPRKKLSVGTEVSSDFSKPFLIEAGKQATVDAYAHLNKDFMKESLRTGVDTSDPRLLFDARVNIQVDVVIYAADGHYSLAKSIPFGVLARKGNVAGASGVSVPVLFTRMPDEEITTSFRPSSK